MKKLLLFALFLGLFSGCKKTEVYPKEDYFYGKWRRDLDLTFEIELTSSKAVKTTYKNRGADESYTILGTGTWSYETSSNNLKVVLAAWTPAFLSPMPDGKTLDSIIETIDANSFYLSTSAAKWKYIKIQ